MQKDTTFGLEMIAVVTSIRITSFTVKVPRNFGITGESLLRKNHLYNLYFLCSLDEIGLHDYKSILDLVLRRTKERKIFFIGHSQGGGAFSVLMSSLPQYNLVIRQAHLISPGVFLSNSFAMRNVLPDYTVSRCSWLKVLYFILQNFGWTKLYSINHLILMQIAWLTLKCFEFCTHKNRWISNFLFANLI